LSELAILLTARHWSQPVEWAIHAPIAREKGIPAQAVQAINEQRQPESLAADEWVVYHFCQQLHQHKKSAMISGNRQSISGGKGRCRSDWHQRLLQLSFNDYERRADASTRHQGFYSSRINNSHALIFISRANVGILFLFSTPISVLGYCAKTPVCCLNYAEDYYVCIIEKIKDYPGTGCLFGEFCRHGTR
jgi:hypothetical protein